MPDTNPPTNLSLAYLDQEAVLELTGPDAVSFLQGQSSADFSGSDTQKPILGTFCNVKGRVLADFLAFKVSDERILLRCEGQVGDALITHLQPYLNFSKSTLRRCEGVVYGGIGDQDGSNVTSSEEARDAGEWFAIPRFSGATEFWHLGDHPAAATTVSADMWYSEMMRNEDARITGATIGKYLPQDLNYDLRGYISFSKGCYTGQEIIARLHYKGKPKRRLYRATCTAESDCAPGSDLIVGDQGKAAGSVVNCASAAGVKYLLIETIENAFDDQLRLADCNTPLQAITD
ncbi:glycine cleavage T-protein [Luminiphilus syltensis NOR5-1B]|uniref:Glycine cleavage T-protein n=1 Tax=Luminiphilus syltensis NOR5-1B TaxID=565045 RepID=B8KR24_9GAMM|nr:folate-binding protein YgfZ [Luminiphilus syltensis]EED36063.1 glycine cleavage T-protein [Luminiphilus syltensis NOR5-1B]